MRKQSLFATVLLSTVLLVTGCKSHIPRDVDNDGKPDSAWINREGKQSALIIKLSSDPIHLRALSLENEYFNLKNPTFEISGFRGYGKREHEITVTPINRTIQKDYLGFFNPRIIIRIDPQGMPYNPRYYLY